MAASRKRAVSGMICAAPVLTTREKMQSVSALYLAPELNITFGHLSKSRQRSPVKAEALWRNLGSPTRSPQCQPTTHTKEKDLDRIEHALHIRYTCFTGRDHR